MANNVVFYDQSIDIFLFIFPKNMNIFLSQVAFSVVAFSGQAVFVLFGVTPFKRSRRKKTMYFLVNIAYR